MRKTIRQDEGRLDESSFAVLLTSPSVAISGSSSRPDPPDVPKVATSSASSTPTWRLSPLPRRHGEAFGSARSPRRSEALVQRQFFCWDFPVLLFFLFFLARFALDSSVVRRLCFVHNKNALRCTFSMRRRRRRDARVDSIRAGHLTKEHSPDVVRSYLKTFV